MDLFLGPDTQNGNAIEMSVELLSLVRVVWMVWLRNTWFCLGVGRG